MTQNKLMTAILLRLLAAFLITAMSASVRGASAHAPVGQIIFWRSSVALVPIVIYMIIRREFPHALRTRYPRMQALRAGVGVTAMALAFFALSKLPVAVVEALGFLAPIIVLPLAAIMLGERLLRATVAATVLGLCGVMAVSWHAMSLPHEGVLIGLAAGLGFAVLAAVARVLVKQLTGIERASTIAFYFAAAGTVAGLATLPWGWAPMEFETARWLILAGVLGGCAHIAATEALLRAPVSVMGPFEYSGLIWAAGFDFVLFGMLPGPWAWIGMGLITMGGVLIVADRARVP